MTLPSILAIAGCIALVISLLGGGIEAIKVIIPKISFWSRVLFGLARLCSCWDIYLVVCCDFNAITHHTEFADIASYDCYKRSDHTSNCRLFPIKDPYTTCDCHKCNTTFATRYRQHLDFAQRWHDHGLCTGWTIYDGK